MAPLICLEMILTDSPWSFRSALELQLRGVLLPIFTAQMMWPDTHAKWWCSRPEPRREYVWSESSGPQQLQRKRLWSVEKKYVYSTNWSPTNHREPLIGPGWISAISSPLMCGNETCLQFMFPNSNRQLRIPLTLHFVSSHMLFYSPFGLPAPRSLFNWEWPFYQLWVSAGGRGESSALCVVVGGRGRGLYRLCMARPDVLGGLLATPHLLEKANVKN